MSCICQAAIQFLQQKTALFKGIIHWWLSLSLLDVIGSKLLFTALTFTHSTPTFSLYRKHDYSGYGNCGYQEMFWCF